MDYKKIIKNRQLRVKIIQMLSFIPDAWMVKLQYRIKTGHKLDLKNPKRFTEKLQWYKLYYRDPLMAQCADKYAVRDYVRQAGFAEILNPIIGVYTDPVQVDWDALPQSFVAKDTLGGGGNDVILVPDKAALDRTAFYRCLQQWVKPVRGKHPGREWVYDGTPHRILIEQFIPSDPQAGGLIDYKFFCFNGKAKYLYILADRLLGQGAGLAIYTRDFKKTSAFRVDERPLTRIIEKPANYNQMLACAEALAAPFPHARVDLYNQDGEIMFGEITFFDGSGYMTFEPDKFDYTLGDAFKTAEEISSQTKKIGKNL